MKKKFSKCENCGATEYEKIAENEYRCVYCDTVYEFEKPRKAIEVIASHNSFTCVTDCNPYVYYKEFHANS